MPNTLEMCRICMSVNIKMFTLINTNMENLYHLLTQVYVDTEDGKPTTVCFLCYARLQQCDRLQQQALKSNELLEELLKGGLMQATENAILNGQYSSQDLQVSSTYHLDLEPANCTDDLLDPKVEANDLISVKEEETIDEPGNVTENLFIIQHEKGVSNYPHPSNSIQILKKDKTSYNNEEAQEINMESGRNLTKKKGILLTNKQNFQKRIKNNHDAEVDEKSEKKWEKTKTNQVSNVQIVQKSIHIKDAQEENVNSPKISKINTITNEFQCNECHKQFSTENILTDHILKCMKTTENFIRDDQLMKANCLLSEMFSCDICTFKTNRKLSIETHLKMHNITKVISCNICEYRCADKSNLKQHIKNHTGEKPFSCNNCEYRCAHKSTLNRHIRTHTGEKPFSCNICVNRYSQKHHLKEHMRTHIGEKSFSCNICEYSCADKSNLKQHVKKHTGEKPYSCNICEYRCADKSNLKPHMKKHTGEKPYACNICEYRFAHKSSLNRHIRTHTGEKPFSCNICVYRYSQKHHLIEHMRTHTGEKPFSCNICEYRFSHKHYLKEHMRTHTGEKPFSCNICEYRCIQKSALNRHLRTHN